jgi:hypothetical protein
VPALADHDSMTDGTTRSLLLTLRGFGRPSTQAAVQVRDLGAGERVKRASIMMGAGLTVALVALPIPLIHLFLPPAALLGGMALAIRRLGQGAVFQRAEGPCPFCLTPQRLNLAGSPFSLPRSITCSSCLQPLSLEESEPGE